MKTYRITHISDMCRVPLDRRAQCLRALQYALELLEFAVGDEDSEGPLFEHFTWTDDGDMSSTIKDQNGKQVIKLKVNK